MGIGFGMLKLATMISGGVAVRRSGSAGASLPGGMMFGWEGDAPAEPLNRRVAPGALSGEVHER